MSDFRCVIFAAVSTQEQARDSKASIPSQIENARTLITRRGWSESAPPLVVPGQSRSIDFLHEAMLEVKAISDLIDLAKHGEIDLVVVRDYDRLSRTRSLLTQISTYLSHCQVQIYALDKPVEPIPVVEFMRKRAIYSSATIEAFAGLEAEREVSKLVERKFFGYNAAMRRGHWIHPITPYGYRREGGADVVAYIHEEETAILRRIESMYLDEGLGCKMVSRRLNGQGVLSPNGGAWSATAISNTLRNPFYAGWIVWGLRRTRKVFSPGSNTLVSKAMWIPPYLEIKEQLGRRPTLQDLINHKEELEVEGAVLVEGQHPALRSLELHNEIEREMLTRYTMKGRATSVDNPNVFTGLVKCAECGAGFTPRHHHGATYYQCSARRHGRPCSNAKYIREETVYEAVMGILAYFAANPDSLKEYVGKIGQDRHEDLETEAQQVEQAIENLSNRRRRWGDAYEAAAVDLNTYGQRMADIDTEGRELRRRAGDIKAALHKDIDQAHQRERLASLVDKVAPLTDENRAALRTSLRAIIESITIQDGRVTRIVFRGMDI